MTPYRTDKIDTPTGEYTIELHYDDGPEQPYDEGFGLALVGDRRHCDLNTGEHSDEILSLIRYHSRENAYNGNIYDSEIRSAAAIARYLRVKYGLKGIREIDHDFHVSEPSSDRGEAIHGLAWAPDDATDPYKYTDNAIKEWRAWANGEVYGFIVSGPDDEHVDSCWGFYGDEEYMLEIAHDGINTDVETRLETAERITQERLIAANHVGAGFIGII